MYKSMGSTGSAQREDVPQIGFTAGRIQGWALRRESDE